jgi:hypothetical protein
VSRPDENDRVAGANAVLDALQTLLLGGHLLPGATTGYVEGFTVFAEVIDDDGESRWALATGPHDPFTRTLGHIRTMNLVIEEEALGFWQDQWSEDEP